MRKLRSLVLATVVSSVAMLCFATGAFAAQPQIVDLNTDTASEHQLNINYNVYPNGVDTDHYLTYFKKVETDQCSSPDPDDEATAESTNHTLITDDLDGEHPISRVITGLDHEQGYCVSFHAANVDGSDNTVYGSYETTGAKPVVTNVSYSADGTHVYYDFNLVPGTNKYEPTISIDYFERSGADCTTEPPTLSSWYHNSTHTGFVAVEESSFIDGLIPGTNYCVRPVVQGLWGDADSIAFVAVSTMTPTVGSISTPVISAPTGGGDATLSVTVGDGGAQQALNNTSDYEVMVHHVTPGNCNAANFFGGFSVFDSNSHYFTDEADLEFDLGNLDDGEAYCIAVFIDSGWGSYGSFGDAYDAAQYTSFIYRAPPEVTDLTIDPDLTSIAFSAEINPNHLATDYGIKYQLKPAATSCTSLSSGWTTKQLSLASGLSTDQSVALVASNLTAGTDYCAYFYTDSIMGGFASPKSLVHTDDPPAPPAEPAAPASPAPPATIALPTLVKFPVSVKAGKKVTGTLACATGCTLQITVKVGSKSVKSEMQIAAGATSVTLKLAGFTPAQLKKAAKKGKKISVSVVAVNSAGKSATKTIKLKK